MPYCLRGRPRSCFARFQALQGKYPRAEHTSVWGGYVDHRLDYPSRVQGH